MTTSEPVELGIPAMTEHRDRVEDWRLQAAVATYRQHQGVIDEAVGSDDAQIARLGVTAKPLSKPAFFATTASTLVPAWQQGLWAKKDRHIVSPRQRV